jgi:hypothetical protein
MARPAQRSVSRSRSSFFRRRGASWPRAENHLANSHFSAGLGVWELPTLEHATRTWVADVGHDAPGSVAVTADGSVALVETIVRQCVGVKAGVTYSIGTWFRYEPGFGGPASAALQVYFYSGAECDADYLHGTGTNGTSTALAMASVFQHVSLNFLAPVGTRSAKVQVNVYTSGTFTAKGHIDDVHLTGGLVGDANGDLALSVLDVFHLVNYLFAGGPFPLGPCDVNNSDAVDVLDVFYLINHLFAGGPAPL